MNPVMALALLGMADISALKLFHRCPAFALFLFSESICCRSSMTTLIDMTPAIENFEEPASSCGLSFDWGATNERQLVTDFTFDDLLAPVAIEGYQEELASSPANVMSLGPLSSPLSTRSDIGAFFDWSVAVSKDEHQGRFLRTGDDWLSPGNHLGLGSSRSVTVLSHSLPSSSQGQPSVGKFDGQSQ